MRERINMERTLVLLKPSTVQRALIGEIISRFEKKGLRIAGMKMMQLNEEILNDHYSVMNLLRGKDGIDIRHRLDVATASLVVYHTNALQWGPFVNEVKTVDATSDSKSR